MYAYLNDILLQLRKYKAMAERAIAQISDEDFFATLDPESNSIAVIVKHIAGNMRSRWTDFLTTDGEKPDRERDREFIIEKGDSKAELMRRWEEGWTIALDTIAGLEPNDLSRTITIRGEPHTVLEAINRQAAHYAAHVGQVVLLAKHYAGDRWQTLSIPRGRSKEFDVAKSGQAYKTLT